VSTSVLSESALPLPLFKRGKVRDTYDLGSRLLIVASDRISAFDSVLPTPIPLKGRVLTTLSVFWFEKTRHIVANHHITTDLSGLGLGREELSLLEGRAMVVKKAEILPVECVIRGYLSGSAWKEYRQSGEVCGIPLPKGLAESEKLPEPIFTPATKATTGHDENISFDKCERLLGRRAHELREKSLELYRFAAAYALARGIILCDTKFEWGVSDGELLLVDEIFTPDSSRFWDAALYKPGGPQPSYDKQFVRDYLERIGWNKEPPAPPLPEEVVQKTQEKYLEALRKLTGIAL